MINLIEIVIKHFDRDNIGYKELTPNKVILGDFPIVRYSILTSKISEIFISRMKDLMNLIAKSKMKNAVKVYSSLIINIIGRSNPKLSVKSYINRLYQIFKIKSSLNKLSIKSNIFFSKVFLKQRVLEKNALMFSLNPSSYKIIILFLLGHWDGENNTTQLLNLDNLTLEQLDYTETTT